MVLEKLFRGFKQVMNKALLVSVLFLALCVSLQALVKTEKNSDEVIATELSQLFPEKKHHKSSRYIASYINEYHYKKTRLDNQQSSQILDEYIEMLDSNKMYFLAEDIESFQKYVYNLDDSIISGQLKSCYDIYNIFQQRWLERNQFAISVLNEENNFKEKEAFYFDREEKPWALTDEELNDYWRKSVKNSALNLMVAGKTWDEAKDVLLKRYQAAIKRIAATTSEDVFSYFMNSYTRVVDPHTSYMSPRSVEDFNSRMRLSFEGIGAYLRTDDVYTKIVDVIAAGPADKTGKIEKGDKIIAIAQGEKGEMVDVVGWRSKDVIDLLRGEAGSLVRLKLEPESAVAGKTKVVSIIREKIKMEEQAAKSELIEIKQEDKNYRIGVIELPSFYIDFQARYEGKKDYRSTTRDVRNLINEMKKDKGIDALVIDLRSNGGGSLDEAASMTGLFIDEGPIVQDKNGRGHVHVLSDKERGSVWDGPMAVLVNHASASASEIFAGAIQDYGRGLIVGEQTFGKGTVQRIFDLNNSLRDKQTNYGSLKLTINKFYRVTGESTQKRGVVPDIHFPSAYPRDEFGEQSYDSALKWDVIKAVDFEKAGDYKPFVSLLEQKHKSRIKDNMEFQFIMDDIELLTKNREKKTLSLNFNERKTELEKDKKRRLDRENARRKLLGKEQLKEIDEDTELTEVDDARLHETANILADLLSIQESNKLVKVNQ
jgi:carboxyl-terminal processing protease